jgi:type I site-specific restriction endonuclease
MDKKGLTETDIRTKFITPATVGAKWDLMTQVFEEHFFTKGRVVVRGKTVARGEARKTDYLERMRQALVNTKGDRAAANSRYVMRITGDNDEGKAQLDNFIDPESAYPVIATEVASMRPRDRALSTAGGGDVLANPHNAHGPHARL